MSTYPCGCSREKVAAGLCDLFDESGNKRSAEPAQSPDDGGDFVAVYACPNGHEALVSGRCGLCRSSRDLVRWDAPPASAAPSAAPAPGAVAVAVGAALAADLAAARDELAVLRQRAAAETMRADRAERARDIERGRLAELQLKQRNRAERATEIRVGYERKGGVLRVVVAAFLGETEVQRIRLKPEQATELADALRTTAEVAGKLAAEGG